MTHAVDKPRRRMVRNTLRRVAMCALVLVAGAVVFMRHPQNHVHAQQKTGTGIEEAVYKCDTPGIRLEGTLIARMFYGPPGFGETPAKDLHDRVLVLKLAKPITVCTYRRCRGEEQHESEYSQACAANTALVRWLPDHRD
jgi:hypothetical protein